MHDKYLNRKRKSKEVSRSSSECGHERSVADNAESRIETARITSPTVSILLSESLRVLEKGQGAHHSTTSTTTWRGSQGVYSVQTRLRARLRRRDLLLRKRALKV